MYKRDKHKLRLVCRNLPAHPPPRALDSGAERGVFHNRTFYSNQGVAHSSIVVLFVLRGAVGNMAIQ